MPENWKSYFSNVNDNFSSIALDLALRERAPMPEKPWLLWVWIYLQHPSEKGMTTKEEFPVISAIEGELRKHVAEKCEGIYAGRITGDSRRELYFYGADKKNFKQVVKEVMSGFRSYRFDFDGQKEPEWNQYLNVLFPSDEDLQRIANRDVLNVMEEGGDTLTQARDVHHWIYFTKSDQREWYASRVGALGYSIEDRPERTNETHPHGLIITRDQSVTPEQINHAVLELFHLAKQIDAEYDGWEAQLITTGQK
jgi:uncharacterized protein (TIGR01619 family)